MYRKERFPSRSRDASSRLAGSRLSQCGFFMSPCTKRCALYPKTSYGARCKQKKMPRAWHRRPVVQRVPPGELGNSHCVVHRCCCLWRTRCWARKISCCNFVGEPFDKESPLRDRAQETLAVQVWLRWLVFTIPSAGVNTLVMQSAGRRCVAEDRPGPASVGRLQGGACWGVARLSGCSPLPHDGLGSRVPDTGCAHMAAFGASLSFVQRGC